MAVVTVVDYCLLQGVWAIARSGAIVPQALLPIMALVGQILPMAAGFGLGALALYITGRFFFEVPLRANTMWALNGCLIPLLYVKKFLPVDGLLIYPEMLIIVMMVVGVFVSGKRYWI